MYEICEIVVIAPDADWLAELARHLLDHRLIARAEITPVRTLSRSDDQIFDEVGARSAMHTRRSRVTAIIDYVERAYPAGAPTVVVVPIIDGNHAYLQWVRNRTKIPK